jgi:two-component system sensor histidine kinase UhpB
MPLNFEKHLRETQRLTHAGSWEWDIATGALVWSEEHYRIFGVSPETFTPTLENAMARVHPQDVPALRKISAQLLESCTTFETEYRVVVADSTYRHVLVRGGRSAEPGPPRAYGTIQDVTSCKEAEAALKYANQRAQALSARVLEVQETERRRIAHELHDEIGQALTAVQFSLQRLRRRVRARSVSDEVEQCMSIAARALDQVRDLSLNLRPAHLDDLGLEAAVTWLLGQQCDDVVLQKSFVAVDVPRKLPPEVEIACFRVAQEALTNILRHAQATDVTVELRCEDEILSLAVEDNGCGFDIEAARARAMAGQSLGLLGMEERAVLAGGGLAILPRDGGGTRLAAYFPLRPER